MKSYGRRKGAEIGERKDKGMLKEENPPIVSKIKSMFRYNTHS